ncbi:MAG TPA: hypothetical protein VIC04_01400 [Terriglobia bacterium]|jgi:hypothetical protein
MTRTIHDMAYDPVKDEVVVPQLQGFGILTFRADADGNAAPVRKILGPSTELLIPEALALDHIHRETFVPQEGRILVFDSDIDGDQAPKRVLGVHGENDVSAGRITVDPIHNLLIGSFSDGIRIYDRMAKGLDKPLRVITGKVAVEVGLLTMHAESGTIFGVVRPGGRYAKEDYVGVWSIYDNGEVPPRWTIGGPNGLLSDARGVAVDPKSKTVIVSDKQLNGVLTFHVPEVF